MVTRIALALGLWAICAGAHPGLYALGSVGEAPMSNVSDMGVTGAMWQAGVQAEITAEWIFAFAKASGGSYLRAYSAEALVGAGAFWPVFFLKPAVYADIGMATYAEREFNFGDAYVVRRRHAVPTGLGARMEAFDRVFLGWEGRNSGLPMWKLEIGWRFL